MQVPKSYRVLVVEDEGLIAADIARRLEALGHTVVATASTAEEAFESAGRADVVLMDIRLDGQRDGIDAALEIRARQRIPVIFVTAHADRATLERAKQAGPFGYVVKPLGPAALQAALEMAVYKHALERQLEEQEAWLRTTLASVADAVVVADAGGHVMLLNRAAELLTGWPQLEAKGRALDAILPIEAEQAGSGAGDLASLAILRDNVVPLPDRTQLAARTGRKTIVEGAVAPVKASPGTLGVVATLRDVGARHWEEAQLRQGQRMEAASKLAASVVNDYSNLISIVRLKAEQLLTQFGQYTPARQAIEEISRAAAAADQITRRLASFGLRQPMQREILSLNGVLRRLAKPIEAVAGNGIAVTVQQRAGIGRIRADEGQLEQAIMNIALHACAVTSAGGTLRLETSAAESRVSGSGACAALTITYSAEERDLDRLFDPSEEADTGLALAIAHSIITEAEGYISATRLTGATQIELLFPVALGAASAPVAAAEPRTILLVDPREKVREHLHNVFESAGYLLLDAMTPEEAIALAVLHEGPLDLLIADEEDAAPVGSALREEHAGIQVLRIVESAEKTVHELRRPFTEQALIERIGVLLVAPQAAPAGAA